jgi:malonate-semialdehyde dehydrogenase (acetylating)/methylmalonate-semialdehyde dehydrogenase
MESMVAKSHAAWLSWREVSVLKRQKIMLNLQEEIRKATPALAQSIVLEQGKTYADAKGDVLRGHQVVETACGIPKLLMGDKLEVSKDMDTYVRREPLGVGAAICPFNFPAMIPLWNMVSIAAGNTLIIKPSERDPGATMIIAELCERAGLPPGVLSVMHGSKDSVNFLCDHPLVKAISFVGGDAAGKHIYDRAGAQGKRVQANMGAKNHAILMPDANKNFALNAITGAAFGAAGQRCMALSVLITVGTDHWLPDLIERAKNLKIGNGFEEGVDLGPVISPQSKAKIETLIAKGGKILLDGRKPKAPEGYPHGNWVGPTVIEVEPGQEAYDTEIFGPVLCVIKRDSLEDAIALINSNRYGNGTAIFTESGATARKFEKSVDAGQIGINVPIPVPLPMFSWSGNKGSVLGGHSLYGDLGLNFWLQNKTVTSFWRADDAVQSKADVAMPTHR